MKVYTKNRIIDEFIWEGCNRFTVLKLWIFFFSKVRSWLWIGAIFEITQKFSTQQENFGQKYLDNSKV